MCVYIHIYVIRQAVRRVGSREPEGQAAREPGSQGARQRGIETCSVHVHRLTMRRRYTSSRNEHLCVAS